MKLTVRVVSLQSSRERREATTAHLGELGLPFRFADAIDGDDADQVARAFACRPDHFSPAFTHRPHPVSRRELACTLSHMLAILRYRQEGHAGPLLMLEDDVLFCGPDTRLLQALLSRLPPDAGYLQLAVLPVATIDALAEDYQRGGELLVAKSGPCSVPAGGREHGCHCTAAYLLTEAGIHAISERWFEGDRVIFPCTEAQLVHNVALVADRLVYQAAASQGATGYTAALPVVTSRALESSLHPMHVEWHREARDSALRWFAALSPRILAT